ncbi:MAG: hypothetical protein L0312_23060 [Acidobacteria bacterium]|nr:hypothetical protein [Acidobacteriota bacterium]
MGFNSSQQEIINTPEAKGMRLQPASCGVSVNFSQMGACIRSKPFLKRHVQLGQFENVADYRDQKTYAGFSSDAARPLQLLQVDPQTMASAELNQPLLLPSDFAGPDDTNSMSSDCQIAANTDNLLAIVNVTLAVFEKSGRQRLRCNLLEIFHPLIGDAYIFNPRAVYDQFRNRWAVAACAGSPDGHQSWFLLAYSQSGNPMDNWWIWALDARVDGGIRTGHSADSLSFAIDNRSFYLTANMFGGQGQFLYAKLRVLNRKEVEVGGVLHGWDFWELRNAGGTPAFGLQPAVNLRAAGVQYLLDATNDGQGLTLWSFMQPPRQNPTLSRRFIPTVSHQLAPNAKQPLTRVPIETGDTRLCNVIFRHGMLWTAHTIAANWGNNENVAAIQWFQINPRAGCVTHQGIYGAPHFHYFSPAVMADGEGNLILVFNRCGETEFPSIRFTGRRPSDEANSLHASLLLQRGAFSESPGWAPSSSACIAPEDSSVWITGQYAATEHDWATWIGEVRFAEVEETHSRFFEKDVAAA